jgi:hypothetical protein
MMEKPAENVREIIISALPVVRKTNIYGGVEVNSEQKPKRDFLEAHLAEAASLLEEAQQIGDPVGSVQFASLVDEIQEKLQTISEYGGKKSLSSSLCQGQQKEEPARNFDAGKLRYDLIPPDALRELARVYTVGAQKYGDRNWEKGMSWGRAFGSLMRHLWDWFWGVEADEEDGLHPLAHGAFRVFQLLAYSLRKIGIDDRPKGAGSHE